MERIEIVEKYFLDGCEYENMSSGLYKKAISQVYWEELYTGKEYDEYQDSYDYN